MSSTPLEQHPLVGRRVRIAPHAKHYPNRYGVITQWLGFDTVMVSLYAYKRAPSRRQSYWLTDVIVQPQEVTQHDQKSRTVA